MKLNRFFAVEDETSKFGLKPIALERLGNVIVLIGKNGAGKSRILNFIEDKLKNGLSIQDLENKIVSQLPFEVPNSEEVIQKLNELIEKKQSLAQITPQAPKRIPGQPSTLTRPHPDYVPLKESVRLLERTLGVSNEAQIVNKIRSLSEVTNSKIASLQKNYIRRITNSDVQQLRDAIDPADEKMASLPFEKLVESFTENLDYNEVDSISKSSLAFLKKLPHQLAADFISCVGNSERFQKRVSYKRFEKFKELFESIFGKVITWEIENLKQEFVEEGIQTIHVGRWKIDNREFNYQEFSDGEKALFAYVLLFFLISQNNTLRLQESIIFVDEPELHLHPDAEIDLLNGLRNLVGEKGQIWIATHSINILSQVNWNEVFVVKDGAINHPSKSIQREALRELLKIVERVEKLSEFLSSISEWTYINFTLECFSNPEVIELAQSHDPQVAAFKDILSLNSSERKSLLLDFGAGKGRLLEQALQDSNFVNEVDYSALEPNNDFHSVLEELGAKKIYSSYTELQENSFDFIVLCNVLHEMKIEDWIPALNKIIAALNSNGYLMILEAKSLSKGEFAGSAGYLILDEHELSTLFHLENPPQVIQHKEHQDRITCVIIPKSHLKQITPTSLMETMVALEENTLRKIEELRKEKSDSATINRLGRQLAFLAQLHINSRLTQKKIKELYP